VEPGPLTITARAWDSTGASQPESAAALWNPKGYANNSWASVRLEAR
jgi:sulfite oxidase